MLQLEQSRINEVRERSVTEREELSGSSLWLCFSRALAVSVKKFPR
jgi:hypothetical protein